MAYLSIQNLTKNFGNVSVLKGISMDIEEGETAVIIGGSGNGKTTLLRCLNGLEKSDGGQVYVNNTLADLSKNNNFGMIFQNFNLFPQYNALNNVTLALNNKLTKKYCKTNIFKKQKMLKLERKENTEFAMTLLDKMGLKEKAYNYPCELSGGQCQRVAIARALALKPDILCFDEPTSALDPKTTADVIQVISELKKDGYTMLIITHDIEFAKKVADTVYYLNKGTIVQKGTVEEILNNPTSSELNDFLGSSMS